MRNGQIRNHLNIAQTDRKNTGKALAAAAIRKTATPPKLICGSALTAFSALINPIFHVCVTARSIYDSFIYKRYVYGVGDTVEVLVNFFGVAKYCIQ